MSCFSSLQVVCKRIVCPPRHSCFNEHQLIQRKFRKLPYYQLFNVTTHTQETLSAFAIINDSQKLPTVIYLHGNGGHKIEALQIATNNINLVAFDFGACGKSQGEYLTYGEKQARQVAAVVDQIKRRYGVRKVAVWGRSMGASIGIMYASLYPRQVSCLILDTPFRWLNTVIRNVAEHNSSVPGFLLNWGLGMVESKVKEMVGSDIFQTDFRMYLNLVQVPALFIYSTMDIVVKQQNVRQLYQAYKGQKQLKLINVMHHQDRPKALIEYSINFIHDNDQNRTARNSFIGGMKKGISMSIR